MSIENKGKNEKTDGEPAHFSKRDRLIQQVKTEYARLADSSSHEYISDQSYRGMLPEAYYERTLERAIHDILDGKYDDCHSGYEVVERMANSKTKARQVQDAVESTLHHMESAEEIIALEPNGKRAQELRAENERRAESIPQMIRAMKEEQAREDLNSDSSNVIGGGEKGERP